MKSKNLRLKSDAGSAVIEFLAFGLVLQVTVLLALIQVSGVQAQQLAAESIARHSLRAFMLSGTQPEITGEQLSFDLGVAAKPNFALSCTPDCLSDGSVVRLSVQLGSAKSAAVAIR